jgi:outer membrane protein TolC
MQMDSPYRADLFCAADRGEPMRRSLSLIRVQMQAGVLLVMSAALGAAQEPPQTGPAIPNTGNRQFLPELASSPESAVKTVSNGNNGADPAKETPKTLPVVSIPQMTLGQCLKLAHERQPTLRGLRASLAGAEAGRRALDRNVPFSPIFARDLPVRRNQADQGVVASRAELEQAEHDVTYAVVRTYYLSVYAREQSKVANGILEYIDNTIAFAEKVYKEGATPEINENTINLLKVYRSRAVGKRIEAEEGITKANDALREVMALDRSQEFDVVDRRLPKIDLEIDRDMVIDQALARRGEIVMAQAGLNVLHMEETAQGMLKFRFKASTAATGADVHTRSIPQGTRDGEYRPDAFGPEYPALIVGSREARVYRAQLLAERADAVLEKTRNLVALEARNGHSRWVESSRKVKDLKPGVEAGDALSKSLKELIEGRKRDLKMEVEAQGLSAEVSAAYNEALYHQIQALAAIERITAGGIRVNYPGR